MIIEVRARTEKSVESLLVYKFLAKLKGCYLKGLYNQLLEGLWTQSTIRAALGEAKILRVGEQWQMH